jgi:hypothetical protein
MRVIVRVAVRLAIAVLLSTLCSTVSFAQSILTGVVRDASGGVLPGVNVEAASPALIEKVRTAVTDGTGQYRIEDLRPGTYTLTISLQGFSTFKREGIELTGGLTITVNADLKVGAVAETVTVTGETPVVDVQSAKRETTLSNQVVRDIPAVRGYSSMVVLVPGVTTNTNDVATGVVTTQFPIHGGRNNEGRMTIDGLNVGNPPGGNQPPGYTADVGNAQEVTFTTAGGGLGEQETAGLVMNLIPKTGGNTFQGSAYYSGSGQALESNNYTQALANQGLPAATPINKIYDFNVAGGGPIRKDKVWFFVSGREQGSSRVTAGIYVNQNTGNPNAWLYVPDQSQPEYSDRTWENINGRLTWQVTPRNKVGGFWDEQVVCRACTGATSGITDPTRVSPEAVGTGQTKPLRVPQVTWSSPMTSRLLLEAGFGGTYYGWGNFERSPNPTENLTRVVEQCAAGCANNGGIPNLTYRSQDWGQNYTGDYTWRATVSYVTGSHSLKAGYLGTVMTDYRTWYTNNTNMTFRLNNGVPNQLTESVSPFINNGDAGFNAFFGQEQWTHNRVTLQAALRFDRATSWFPQQQEGPTVFLPNPIILPATTGVNSYKDFSPRFGAAWDVFGNGKTAVKASIGRYLEGVGFQLNYELSDPSLRLPSSTSIFGTLGVTRSWNDANKNFVPDCNLQSPAANGECGAISNQAFGTAQLTSNYDPNLLNGWGVRSGDWAINASVQQQIASRASLEVAYARRWYHGFTVTDNQAVGTADWNPYSIVAPSDSRLPGGGGYTIGTLYDVTSTKFGQVNNYITDSSAYGQEYSYFNGVDVSLNVRAWNGLTLQGGTSTGQSVADACAVRANLPELSITSLGPGLNGSAVSTTSPYCHVAFGILTQARGLATYRIPKIDVLLSTVFQSKPGALLAANYAMPSVRTATTPANVAVVSDFLGHAPSGNVANVTVNLIQPGTMYGDRINQLDFRVAKSLAFGRTRSTIGLDIYNALNSSAILTYNNAFVPGGSWLAPIAILTPRIFRISAEFTF